MKLNNEQKRKILLKFFNEYKFALYNYAVKILGENETAEDVVQNTFLRLYENLDKIRDEEKIKSWIFITARNEIFGLFRQKKKTIYGYEQTDEGFRKHPADFIETAETIDLLKHEISNLDVTNREILILREFGQLSYKEISEITGLEVSKIKNRLFKTRKKLMKKLKSLENEND